MQAYKLSCRRLKTANRSCEDVELACRVLFGVPGESHELDVSLPFKEPTPLPNKLRFGYYTADNFIKTSPACVRAVTQTVEALRKQGHECIEFDPFLGQYLRFGN